MMKMVIIIRKDLKMRRGKECSQAAHAACEAVETSHYMHLNEWKKNGKTKICVRVNSEEELLTVYRKAKDAAINCSLILDAGRTEFKGEQTYTAVAIGPDTDKEIDAITGLLPLY